MRLLLTNDEVISVGGRLACVEVVRHEGEHTEQENSYHLDCQSRELVQQAAEKTCTLINIIDLREFVLPD